MVAALGGSQAAAQTGCPTPNTPEPYPNCTYPTPHSLGQCDRMQSASFKVNPPDMATPTQYWGLPHRHVIYDLLLRNDQGKYYLASNSVLTNQPGGTLTAFPWLETSSQEAPGGGLVPDPRYKSWNAAGPATQTLGPNGITYSVTNTGPAPNGEDVTYDENSFEYNAPNSDIHLKGPISGNGTSWDLPWREPSGATGEFFYNIHGYKLEGTYFGEHVTGHVVVETMWATAPYRTSWWVRNRIGHWAFAMIDYKNGESEAAQFLCGEYGFRAAIVTGRDGNSTVNTDNINAYAKPWGTLYDLGGGKKWKFVNDPDLEGLSVLHFGSAQRVKEKRKIKSADAVNLTAGGRLCTPERLPGGSSHGNHHGHGHHHGHKGRK